MSVWLDQGRVPAARPWLTVRHAIWLFAIVAAMVAAGLAVRFTQALAAKHALSNKTGVPTVSVTVAGRSVAPTTVNIIGTIAARYDTPIGVEGDGGRVAAVYVEAGDRVKRGQVLARLDVSVLQPQVANLQAALELSRAEADLAAAEYHRAAAVGASGALSAEETERRRSSSVTAAAKVKVAAAQLAEAQARLARAEVRAPADGILLTRSVEVGQTATPGGGALFRLAEGSEVELRGQVAEQDLPLLQGGPGRERAPDRHVQSLSGSCAPAGRRHRSADSPGVGTGLARARPEPAPRRVCPRRGDGEQCRADRPAANRRVDGR